MKTIKEAESSYQATRGAGKYGTLEELAAAKLITPSLASGVDNGYRFKVTVKGNSYEVVAVPINHNKDDKNIGWSFYMNESGIIRGVVYNGVEANLNDPPIKDQ